MDTQRQIIVIEGSPASCIDNAQQLTQNIHTLQLDDAKKAQQYLGQEFDAVVYNTQDGNSTINGTAQFDPNAFGAIVGTIRAGGYLLLLKSTTWSQHSLFLNRFDTLLKQYKNIRFIQADEISLSPLAKLPQRQTKGTLDQEQAVEAIIKVIKGHRRRPLVISADRGRGKSAALGIAAAQLYQQGYKNIIICAPSKKTATVVFQHYEVVTNTPLQFLSPDELQKQKPKADLVLIDEAAAIPVPLLESFTKQYSRIVFASTLHGYEGSGRGFTLSFKKSLDIIAPEWKKCALKTPIRWNDNDTLEQFVFDALLLNAEAADNETIKNTTLSNCSFEQISQQKLQQNESLLKEVFGLLVSAHYQTKPSDFKQMLDDPNISILILRYQQHVIAVSLIIKEGNIEKNLAINIFEGTRRIKGNLIAQALAANVGIQDAPCLQGQRIIRIAVHPSLQQQGFGTHLLHHIEKQLSADYLGTSFGANCQLLDFWKKSGYIPVYLSMKRDASSGTHSVIMLKKKTHKGEKMQKTAYQHFIQSFPYLLSDPFRNLETKVSFQLLVPANNIVLSSNEEEIIYAFAKGQRGYENSLYPIWKLILKKLGATKKLKQDEIEIIILKVLQKHSWKTCNEKTKKGKSSTLKLLRKSIFELFYKI